MKTKGDTPYSSGSPRKGTTLKQEFDRYSNDGGWEEELVEEIMQTGFDVAMGGQYDKSEEWNNKYLEKEYQKAIKKYSKLIASELQKQKEEFIKMLEGLEPRVMGEDSPSGGWIVFYESDIDNIIKKIEEGL